MVQPRQTRLADLMPAPPSETDPVWPETVLRVAKRFAATINTRAEAWDLAVLLIALIPTRAGQRRPDPRVWMALPSTSGSTAGEVGGRRWVRLPADEHVDDEEMHAGVDTVLSEQQAGRDEPPLILWVTARRDPASAQSTSIPTEMDVRLSTVPGLIPAHLDDPALLDGLT